jgi:hypothetical protein
MPDPPSGRPPFGGASPAGWSGHIGPEQPASTSPDSATPDPPSTHDPCEWAREDVDRAKGTHDEAKREYDRTYRKYAGPLDTKISKIKDELTTRNPDADRKRYLESALADAERDRTAGLQNPEHVNATTAWNSAKDAWRAAEEALAKCQSDHARRHPSPTP